MYTHDHPPPYPGSSSPPGGGTLYSIPEIKLWAAFQAGGGQGSRRHGSILGLELPKEGYGFRKVRGQMGQISVRDSFRTERLGQVHQALESIGRLYELALAAEDLAADEFLPLDFQPLHHRGLGGKDMRYRGDRLFPPRGLVQSRGEDQSQHHFITTPGVLDDQIRHPGAVVKGELQLRPRLFPMSGKGMADQGQARPLQLLHFRDRRAVLASHLGGDGEGLLLGTSRMLVDESLRDQEEQVIKDVPRGQTIRQNPNLGYTSQLKTPVRLPDLGGLHHALQENLGDPV
ncbi:hypothetical protein N7492_010719 [Penicillium capsulatum]|uniref:Uncharacterized protein n=1 Tax=Penicillium capsulatum TaxID=69766 RepID=A0A9W9HNB0_9EURO|nr:hypothetical protein N7492_010719 [Penicillium capsulatum]KAJ6114052.1 hypothetical protein N7512_007497 [Penicillium capsulatum]